MSEKESAAENIKGGPLKACGKDPVTGFYRDGFCATGPADLGSHTVCAIMTDEFLQFTKEQGNDLSSPNPSFGFPGLKAGDRWCLCASRWLQAYENGVAPKVDLEATNKKALKIVPQSALESEEFFPH